MENRFRDPPGAPQGMQGVLRDDLERARPALGVPQEWPGSAWRAPSEVILRDQNLTKFRIQILYPTLSNFFIIIIIMCYFISNIIIIIIISISLDTNNIKNNDDDG